MKSEGFQKVLSEDYQDIIHNHAVKGWRFVQMFVFPSSQAVGFPEYFELIFEKAAKV